METHLLSLVEEIEAEKSLLIQRQFRSTLNQPNLLAINSKQATGSVSADGFSKFAINLPRPALDVDTIQLVNANIPQCVPNIPDTACAFWYYRLSEYSGKVPNPNNLFFVRLLPSYYKPEFIADPQLYGMNVTFNSYQDVSTQLALSCVRDLANTNLAVQNIDDENVYDLHFLPKEISIVYNPLYNKFVMTGTNATTSLAYKTWDIGTTYALGDIVVYGTQAYKSLIAANTGNQPNTSPDWEVVYVEIVEDFEGLTPYRAGQYVAYNDTLYYAVNNNYGGGTPDINIIDWTTVIPTTTFYRYLITGYDDPNVRVLQGEGRQQWNEYALFEQAALVEWEGSVWSAMKQSKGFVPFTINNAYTWDIGTDFSIGDLVLYNGIVYKSLVNGNVGNEPDISLDWTEMNWDNVTDYNVGDIVFYGGSQYLCKVKVITENGVPNPAPNASASWYSFAWSNAGHYSIGDIISYAGVFYIATENSVGQIPGIFSNYWSPNLFWEYLKPTSDLSFPKAPFIGLKAITSQFDYVDVWGGAAQYPFPVGVAGQPYNPNPQRILNTILGFTWNGVMSPELLADIDGFVTATSTSTVTTELFNRVRPVPEYFVRYAPALMSMLGSQTATATQSYTADGYCNLVYSSIIYIYATIVYGSTLDTQRNTNLLAMGSMDCGNLGVSFFNPIVNNPLKVSGSDLYSIQFELVDECGEPYVMTNNAVVSFVLKVSYKKDA